MEKQKIDETNIPRIKCNKSLFFKKQIFKINKIIKTKKTKTPNPLSKVPKTDIIGLIEINTPYIKNKPIKIREI